MKSTKEILRALPLFGRLSDEVLATVEGRCVVRTVGRGTILFRKDEPCRGMYVVVEGSVRVYRANREGREQVLHVLEPGHPLAEVPLFDRGPYPASARAEEDVRLLFLPIDDFEHLYRTNPEIADAVIRELGRRLRRMVGLVEKISLRDVGARVAMTVMEHAERAGALANGKSFTLSRTQAELASELATTRESVARALGRLKREGAIGVRGARIEIHSVAALEAVAFAGGR